MSELAIQIRELGKMYRLYRHPADKVLDALGVNRLLLWRRGYYESFWALRNVNLQVARGERLGIIGRNGAGKSTLLKIITGNIPATEGAVRVAGQIEALLELGTGFHPEFTGRENVRAALAYQGISTAAIRTIEEDVIDFAELDTFIDQPVKTYSAGMYARLAFSTATAIQPEVLIIDEVLGAGDAYFASKCIERMKNLTEGGAVTVLFVSHDLGSVQKLCDRIIWIDRGKIVEDGRPVDVVKSYYASILAQEEVRLRARNLHRHDDKTEPWHDEAAAGGIACAARADQVPSVSTGRHGAMPAPRHSPEVVQEDRDDVATRSPASADVDAPVLLQQTVDKFYSQYAEFANIELFDAAGKPQVVFAPGEAIRFAVEIIVRQPVPACQFAIDIYTLTNEVIASLKWPLAGGLTCGRYQWQIALVEPLLRQNEYVLSAALIDTSKASSNEETVFFCRWNRSLSLRIEEGRPGRFGAGLLLMQTRPPTGSTLTICKSSDETPTRSETSSGRPVTSGEIERDAIDIPHPDAFRQQVIAALGHEPDVGPPERPSDCGETHVCEVTLKEYTYRNALNETIGLTVAEPAQRRWENPVIAIHQTNNSGRRELFGLSEDQQLDYGLALAARGHRVFAADLFLTGDRSTEKHWDSGDFYDEYPRWSMIGKMLRDLHDLVHVMRDAFGESGPIHCFGHSMGGVLAYFLPIVCPFVSRVVCNAAYCQAAVTGDPWDAQFYERRVLNRAVGGLCLTQHLDLVISLASIRADVLLICYKEDTIMDGPVPTGHEIEHMKAYSNRAVPVILDGGHAFPPPVREAGFRFLETGVFSMDV